MSQDWNAAWRHQTLPTLADETWDLIVIGGGISGAGILREAARRGWRCLLLEQRDFAWGTSSRSSKMVHGGLRYIAKGQWRLTRDSVRERQRLLDEAPGLVEHDAALSRRLSRASGVGWFVECLRCFGRKAQPPFS
jgi:glycerol-3-phosphate dehydrogenase